VARRQSARRCPRTALRCPRTGPGRTAAAGILAGGDGLLAEPVTVAERVAIGLEHGTGASDAINKLRARTHPPRILWAGLSLIGSILALAVGCTLLA